MFSMEENSDSNEPSTSAESTMRGRVPASVGRLIEGFVTASMEADSISQNSDCFQNHPQDKSILDLIDKFHTRRATQWALFSWNSWKFLKSREDSNQSTIPLFYDVCDQPVEVLDRILARFVTECKNRDNEDYTPETLRGILFGLQRFLKAYCTKMDKQPISFIKNEYQFPLYTKAFKKKTEALNEIGVMKRNAQAFGITPEQEKYLWDVGAFGCDSAEVLSDTVFFYVVKIFGIASSSALRFMKPDTFVFGENEMGKYLELETNFVSDLDIYDQTSCCHNMALLVPNTTTKLRHYCNESNPRTFYNILQYYVELIKLVDVQEKALFLKPRNEMMFASQAIGRLQLQKKFGKIMESANVKGYYTTQALVQSCLDNLQVKGFMVRKKQTFLPQQQLEISKLLDPPPGIVKTLDVKTQTKAVLKLVNASQGLKLLSSPSNMRYVIQLNQAPQSSSTYSVTQKQSLPEKTTLQMPTSVSQEVLNAWLCQGSKANYMSTVSNFNNQLSAANKNLPKTVTEFDSLATSTVKSAEAEQVESIKVKSEDDSVNSEQVFPVHLSKAGNDGHGKPVQESGNDSDGTSVYEFENIIIKKEPADYEGECFMATEAQSVEISEGTNESHTVIPRKRKVETDDNARKSGQNKTSKIDNSSVKSKTQKSNDKSDTKIFKSNSKSQEGADPEEQKTSAKEECDLCSAEIEYQFTNDLTKKVMKQEISLKEEGQTMFNFSGTSKMGRHMSDLDINLGDYLPENCTIKPGNIDIKRIILPDGGKMVINLKYSLDK